MSERVKGNCKLCGRHINIGPKLYYGFERYTEAFVCRRCYDKEQRDIDKATRELTINCRQCDGTGKTNGWTCTSCDGQGETTHTERPNPIHVDGQCIYSIGPRHICDDW